jgi:phospholipid-binding lipoprotein MlaA
MHTRIKTIALLILTSVLFNCASNEQAKIEQRESGNQAQTAQDNEKVKSLSEYEQTSIETSNGTLTIEPTVVSTTDRAVASDEDGLTAEYYDPLEFINRPLFKFNHFTYQYAFIPAAKAYNAVLPNGVKTSVSNVFSNIAEPLSFINNALSGEISESGNNLGRFLVNTTVGLLGIFDPATSWLGIEKKPQSFAETLTKYNVGSGAYIVLPFLGQSDVRGTASIVSESFIHPTKYIFASPEDTYVRAFDGFNDFTSQAQMYITLFENTDDPYIYFRNQYIQSRNRDEFAQKEQSEVKAVSGGGNE